MNKVRHLVALILLLGFFSKASAQQDATIKVYLPYNGVESYWNITFTDKSTWQQYSFNTTTAQFPSGTVGTLPEGVYDVYFQSYYSGEFSYNIANDYYNDFQWGPNWIIFTDIPIIGLTHIAIQPLD